jgi:hypothetical protein
VPNAIWMCTTVRAGQEKQVWRIQCYPSGDPLTC